MNAGIDKNNAASTAITDAKLILQFTSNPNFPYLVSFPRTGSHWLRMLMELYFEKPSLVRAFFYKTPDDFTCYHHHDLELKLERKNVLYLYREPVATIFSQMMYHDENIRDIARIKYWTELYGKHLEKWLIHEHFTEQKTILRYENLKSDLDSAFAKVCKHLKKEFIASKLNEIAQRVSKDALKQKTLHDMSVVNITSEYNDAREIFNNNYTSLIVDSIYKINKRLVTYL